MGITDIVVLIVIGVFGIKGLIKGLISEVFGVLGLTLGYVVAYQFYSYGAQLVNMFGIDANISDKVGFVLVFLLIYILLLILGFVMKKFFKMIQLGWADKGGGFFFGATKAAVIMGIVLSIVMTFIPPKAKIYKDLTKSPVASQLLKITPHVFNLLNKLPEVQKRNPFQK